jgi:fumarate reductase flavoprotein subunit
MKIKFIVLGVVGVLLLLSYKWTSEPSETVDLVVIGAGASGMSAALEAEATAVRVILLEKMPYVGGNTVRATAGMNAVSTDAQSEIGIVDDVETFVSDILESGHSEGNPRMIEIMASESASALDWLTAKGADLSDVGILAGHSMPRTHRPSGGQPVGGEIVRVLKDAIQSSTVDLRLEHKAVQIMLDQNHEISGVGVVDRTGRKYTIHTKKVIIATGGFGGSPEVFVYYNQKLKGYHTTNSPSATGDFIGLVENLGVQLVDMSYIQTHPTVSLEYGVLITEAIRGNGGILINSGGKRFANEMKNRDFLSEDLLSQPDKEVYLIFNEKVRESLAASDDYIDMDLILSAPDVETLANTLRIDTQNLSETMDRYNGFVENQVDLDFGRRSLTVILDEGPFYAVRVTPAVHYCMGGILIDEQARVIDDNGKPIAGLYASGEATGGIHGLNRLGGNSLLDAIVFGRIAGRSAVE